MKEYPKIILVILIAVLAFSLTVLMVRALPRSSSTDGSVAGSTSAQAHHSFSSPSSEAASDMSAAFTFDDLLDAIEWVESKGDPWAVGDNGDAVGAYQIHKIYVDDVVRIDRRQIHWAIWRPFNYSDRYDATRSREMVSIYLKHYGGTFEEMARKHNGGPQGHKKESTKPYWAKVKARLEAK